MQADTIYHIYNHANGEENLFRSDENYHYFLRQWAKYIEPVAGTYAYCLMPNHFHFLIRIKSVEVVLKFVQSTKPTLQGFETLGGFPKVITLQFSHLFNSYSQAFNKMYDRRGSLFIPNFKRKEIDSNQYLSAIMSYIHRNPIHHGFCTNLEDWSHSSYHAYLSNKHSKIQRDYMLEWFGNKTEFIRFHQEQQTLPDQSLFIDF